MSGIVNVVGPLAKRWGPLLLAWGPKVWEAARHAQQYLADHPEVPNWVRKQLDVVQTRLVEAARKRGAAAQVRAALAVVRDEARRAGSGLDPTAWVSRADAIESGVRLAETQTGAARRRALAGLKTRTADLSAELLDAMVDRTSSAG